MEVFWPYDCNKKQTFMTAEVHDSLKVTRYDIKTYDFLVYFSLMWSYVAHSL